MTAHPPLDLIRRVLLRGITADLLDDLRSSPALAEAAGLQPGAPGSTDLDAWAAEHYDLFGMNVFPNAAAYLDPSGMLGGAVAESVQAIYRQAGAKPSSPADGPDHIGNEIGLLLALEPGLDHPVSGGDGHLKPLAIRLWQDHLGPWLPPFHKAVRDHGSPFYAAVVEALLALLSERMPALPETAGPAEPEAAVSPEQLIAEPETRLRDIAGFLLTPALSGVAISRADIARFGRRTRLPRGFGDRRQMLTNLLRTSAEYDQLTDILQLVDEALHGWVEHYAGYEKRYPSLAPAARRWRRRAEGARALIAGMQASTQMLQ